MRSHPRIARFVIHGCLTLTIAASAGASDPIVGAVVFAERDGIVAVEAEHFFAQEKTKTRAFHLTTADTQPRIRPDGDPSHVAGASGGAYLEVLPDSRRTHGDKLIPGKNFSPQPGKLAVLKYKVHFSRVGRYYVWVRAYSTGSEDNGLHVGIDGNWPPTGQRLQWCKGKKTWRWESMQRTKKKHCGEPHKIYLDVKEAGEHVIQFSMREDGFEFDKWIMTTDRNFARPNGVGPGSLLRAGKLPKPFRYVKPDQPSNRQSTGRPPLGSPTTPVNRKPLILPRKPNGKGNVEISGERKTWHKITVTLGGPYAHEHDNAPNPFTDYHMTVSFSHSDGQTHIVPGYFAADGNAANTSAESGTKWRAHFAPGKVGKWRYRIRFRRGKLAALDRTARLITRQALRWVNRNVRGQTDRQVGA